MGIQMNQIATDFTIFNDNKAKALAAIKALAGKESIKDSSGPHFSWVRTKDFLTADTLEAALGEWRWDAITDNDGNITGLEFTGEKLGMKLFSSKPSPLTSRLSPISR